MDETAKMVPTHLGFIVDGNRRWAKEHGLPSSEGHRRGYEVLKKIAYVCKDRGIEYMSAYIFSTENWGRSADEVGYLMKLFLLAFRHDMRKFIDDGFRIVFLGRRDRVSQEILDIMDEAETESAGNSDATLAIHFNYGGHAEIIDAARHLAADAQSGRANLAEMTDDKFRRYLYHPEVPDMDMMVRTSGEQRVSGFALWRIAYSELMFLDKKWPDMSEDDIDNILNEYASRQRRFGK